jgi:BirA family biotin operon repressor/biotin-[acetyl-CoA-carboxylase] ligase
VLLTAWAAVSVCALVGQVTGRRPRLKWPNDILFDGNKLCGILLEQRAVAGRRATVAGIGLNVSQSAAWFAGAGLSDATSLAIAAASNLDWAGVARQLIHQLDEEYDRLLGGDLATAETSWQQHLGLLGNRVRVERHGQPDVEGLVREVSFQAIVLESPAGELQSLIPEQIRHVITRD